MPRVSAFRGGRFALRSDFSRDTSKRDRLLESVAQGVLLKRNEWEAKVAKLVDAPDLGSGSVRSKGSSPFLGISKVRVEGTRLLTAL